MGILPVLLAVALGQPVSVDERIRDIALGVDGCVVMPLGQALRPGNRLVLLGEARAPTTLVVGSRRDGQAAPADCTRVEQTMDGARGRAKTVALPRDFQGGPFFAVRMVPGLQTIAGSRHRLPAAESRRLARQFVASFPGRWSEARRLVHAYRYGDRGGATAVELYVGIPTLNAPGATVPIREIAIRRAFIIGERVLAVQDFDRGSGREERVDTEPPELTYENWSDSETERTVAFASQGGRRWKRFYTDIGFEGINWAVQDLQDELAEERVYMYTPH